MAWVKIDDQFADHPKAAMAGPLGIAMQVAALCYANRYLTDGFIPCAVAPRLLDLTDLAEEMWDAKNPDDSHVEAYRIEHTWVIAKMVASGLWEDVQGGWQIHDYLDYNPSRADTLTKRAADLDRKKNPQRPPSNSARNPTGIHQDSKRPVPGPVPDPPKAIQEERLTLSVEGEVQEGGELPAKAPPTAPKRRDKRATPTPDDFPISVEMEQWAEANAPGVDLRAETQRFLNRNRSKGETYVDWPAAWRNWMTSPYAKNTRDPPARASPNGQHPSNEQAKFTRSIAALQGVGGHRGPADIPEEHGEAGRRALGRSHP